MTTTEMVTVLNAFNSGKKIQKRGVLLTPMSDGWVDINDYDTWDFGSFEYRIKPEKKVCPYTEQKQFLEDMRVHGPMLFHKYSLWTRSIRHCMNRFSVFISTWRMKIKPWLKIGLGRMATHVV